MNKCVSGWVEGKEPKTLTKQLMEKNAELEKERDEWKEEVRHLKMMQDDYVKQAAFVDDQWKERVDKVLKEIFRLKEQAEAHNDVSRVNAFTKCQILIKEELIE